MPGAGSEVVAAAARQDLVAAGRPSTASRVPRSGIGPAATDTTCPPADGFRQTSSMHSTPRRKIGLRYAFAGRELPRKRSAETIASFGR
jgi:hypothetical protein